MAKDTSNNKKATGLKREAPPGVIAVALVLVLLCVGAGVFYFVNGGWQTQSQKDDYFYHNYLPLLAASHGDKDALDKENALRKQQGKPLLVPDNRPIRTHEEAQKLAADNIARAKALEAQSAGH